jgi:hypothetical protein
MKNILILLLLIALGCHKKDIGSKKEKNVGSKNKAECIYRIDSWNANFLEKDSLIFKQNIYTLTPWEHRFYCSIHIHFVDSNCNYPIDTMCLMQFSEQHTRNEELYLQKNLSAQLNLEKDSFFALSTEAISALPSYTFHPLFSTENFKLFKDIKAGIYKINKDTLILKTFQNNELPAFLNINLVPQWQSFSKKNKGAKTNFGIRLPLVCEEAIVYRGQEKPMLTKQFIQETYYNMETINPENPNHQSNSYIFGGRPMCVPNWYIFRVYKDYPMNSDTLDEKFAQTKWLILDTLPDSIQIVINGYKSNIVNMQAIQKKYPEERFFACQAQGVNIFPAPAEIKAYLPNGRTPLRIENYNLFGYSPKEQLTFLPTSLPNQQDTLHQKLHEWWQKK